MGFSSTARLLSSSLLLAVSGGFKVYIAYLMLGLEQRAIPCLASSLIIYSVYTLDRSIKSREDEVNLMQRGANRRLCLFFAGGSLLAAALILSGGGISPLVAFWPLAVGLLYSKGLKLGKSTLKLKGSLGVKNFVVAFTWASSLLMLMYPFCSSYPELLMVSIFFLKSLMNTIIYDFRDVEGDSLAGINTLPLHLSRERAQTMLYLLHLLLHTSILALVLLGFVRIDVVILLYSFFAGMLYILLYINGGRKLRDVVVDGEWIHMAVFRDIFYRSIL